MSGTLDRVDWNAELVRGGAAIKLAEYCQKREPLKRSRGREIVSDRGLHHLRPLGSGVPRLINMQPCTAGHCDLRHQTPTHVLNRATRNSLLFHLGYENLNVVAQ